MIRHEDTWRLLFRFSVNRDGSIYISPCIEDLKVFKRGIAIREGNFTTIKYSEGEDVDDLGVRKDPHTSFHASGTINSAGRRFTRSSLRGLKEQTELFYMLLRHPSERDEPKTIRGMRDICLKYALDEECPLYIAAAVAPPHESRLLCVPSATNQLNLHFHYRGLDPSAEQSELMLQIALSHGPKGLWPPNDYVWFFHEDDPWNHQNR